MSSTSTPATDDRATGIAVSALAYFDAMDFPRTAHWGANVVEMITRPAPTRWSAAVFAGKSAALRLLRFFFHLRHPPTRHPIASDAHFPYVLAESLTPLRPEQHDGEIKLQEGKIQNLRLAAARLNRVAVPAAQVFSFWKQIGRTSRRKGYVDGRMLQQGCLIPSVGGGLCQLSNALYDVCLNAGCEIVERHAHSRIVPGSAAALGRDATVAWNYVDFRFRAPVALLIEAVLTETDLVVRLRGADRVKNIQASFEPLPPLPPLPTFPISPVPAAESCATCGQEKCFRHPKPQSTSRKDSALPPHR
jgi:hypothetical protein